MKRSSSILSRRSSGSSLVRFWRPPITELREASRSGELLAARIRLGVVLAIAITPILHLLDGSLPAEGLVGMAFLATAAGLAWVVYDRARRGVVSPNTALWSGALDVTLISGALALFAFISHPLIATNSQSVFLLYLLAITATALRYDPRACLLTGGLAILQYAALVVACAAIWPLERADFVLADYGSFSWHTQAVRLLLLVAQTAVVHAVLRRSIRLWEQSVIDRRTGLFNHAFFTERLAELLGRLRSKGGQLALAMVDIDHFKRLNDRFGHVKGDEVLAAVGRCLRDGLRHNDYACRFGGDEFALILTDVDPPVAVERSEQLRASIERLFASGDGPLTAEPVTISAGIALAPRDGTRPEELIGEADRRLYAAKRLGRNRVIASDPEAEGTGPETAPRPIADRTRTIV